MGGVVLMGGVLRPVPGGVVCRDWLLGPGEHASRPGVSPNVSRISSAGIPASRMGGGGGCSSGARPGSSAWRPPPTRSTAAFAKLGVGQPKLPVLPQVMLRSRLLASRFRPQGGGGGGIFRGEVRLGEREGGRAAKADCAREPRFSPKPGPGERPDLLMGGSPGDSPPVVCLPIGGSPGDSPVHVAGRAPKVGQSAMGDDHCSLDGGVAFPFRDGAREPVGVICGVSTGETLRPGSGLLRPALGVATPAPITVTAGSSPSSAPISAFRSSSSLLPGSFSRPWPRAR
mmetsp:Transcript_38068/g.82928  ORF Transcript_38068/g.82928 Transcript_38068/m.82928 type:complete len:286 (-) Transcript_38068:394-1251(-)